MTKKESHEDWVTVYPSPEASMPGVTSRVTRADPDTAERLIASRAFTNQRPDGDDVPRAESFDEAERDALDRWVSPTKHGDHYKAVGR